MKMLTASLLVCVVMALTTAAAAPEAKPGEKTVGLTQEAQNDKNKTCPSCPTGWTLFNGRCFIYVPTVKTWADAERNCLERGGNLASVHSSVEYYVIQGIIQSADQGYPLTWLGGFDAQQEGTWFWSDGTPFDFTLWDAGQPDNRADAHCLLMNFGDNKKYDDQPCSYLKTFICVQTP